LDFVFAVVLDFVFAVVLDFVFAVVLTLFLLLYWILFLRCHPERSGRASASEVEGPLPIL
jgi:uncharacterized membrane protein